MAYKIPKPKERVYTETGHTSAYQEDLVSPVSEKESFKMKKEVKEKRLTIYDIKRETAETEPYFFSPKTMKFFGQRLSDYSVYKRKDGKYDVVAPSRDSDGKLMGYTRRVYNPDTKKLEFGEEK